MSKILIEFYSGRTSENIMSILNERFDRVCFLISPEKHAPTPIIRSALSELTQNLFGFSAEFFSIKKLSVDTALQELMKLWNEGNRYCIDVTGGDEAFIAAAGIFMEQKGQSVTIHQYDVHTGKKRFCYPTQEIAEPPFPHAISAETMLKLNGTIPLEKPPSYIFTRGPLRQEILRLWNTVKTCPKEWNRYCSLDRDPGGASCTPTQKEIDSSESARAYQSISARLKNIGVLGNEKKIRLGQRNYVRFDLNVTNEALFLYDKAGTILEMYCALCAHESGLFHDIRVGVKLDWDGRIVTDQTPNPYNEIDLLLMKENLPILISCKNTVPKNDQLYEIMVMAKHYGGYYATPALFCSGNATEGIRKRAAEMGIVLIDGIRYKSSEQMALLLQKKFL